MDGICLWYWLKVRYESAVKFDPMKRLYGEKIWLLKLKAGGSLVEYIVRFQGLAILWQWIDYSIEPEDRLVTQMAKQTEDPLLCDPYEIIKNWETNRHTFRNASATLWEHEISKMIAQTKKEINDEINRPLLGKASNKKIATGKENSAHEFKLGGPEYEKRSEDCVPFKVWKMLTLDYQEDLCRGDSVNIGFVKEDVIQMVKQGGGSA